MSNNFLNLENAGANGKNSTDTLLSLLQLNNLLTGGAGGLGSNGGLLGGQQNGLGSAVGGVVGGGAVGVGTGLGMFNNTIGGSGGIVGGGGSGIGRDLSKHQQFQQQLQQHQQQQQQQWSGNGLGSLGSGVGGGGGGGANVFGSGSGNIGSHAQKVHTGRAITNSGNLANNHYGQQQQHQQQHQQPDIFSQALSGSGKMLGGDGGDFKSNVMRGGGGLDNSILKASYRNGGDGGSGSGAFSDFGEFMSRDPFFSNMHQSQQQQQQQQPQHHQQQQHHQHNARHSSSGSSASSLAINHAFPTIGTFSVDTSTNSSSSSHSNNMFGGGGGVGNIGASGGGGGSNNSHQPNDIFSSAAHSNNMMMNGGGGNMNGGGGGGGSGGGGGGTTGHGYGNNNSGGDQNQATRETGIIEKLLQHSYGFIQCCERQARLFFHFSQFSGNIEHLKIGDPVEFEMTYDRRTGKPIASHVTKIAPEVVLSEERVTGTVTTELKSDTSTTSTGGETTTGRISYENRGECFFLPYNKDDVEGNVTLCAGDKVSFQIATNQRGNLGACHIRLENPVHPVKYRGVVCTMKESFGFIERADVVKEIFFHFSEAEGTVELRPGDDVEFIIQTRNVSNNLDLLQGKEVACNITRLPPGSVVFEDIATTIYKGQVLKPLDRANQQRPNNDPLPGRIRYRAPDHSEVEVPFGDKDQKGEFTLRHGDWVQFLLATDRRDQLQRATAISLLEETFGVSGERREQGVVAALKAEFGFLRCVDRNVRLFFHLTEVLDTSREICVGDEVEFTTIQDPGSSFANNRLSAIRIKHLPPGLVQFETLMENNVEGIVTREAPKSPIKSTERMEGGVITYTQANIKKTIMYFLKDCDKPPRVGDQVRFDICQVKRNKEMIAVNIVDMLSATAMMQHQQQQQQQQQQLQQQLNNMHLQPQDSDQFTNSERCISKLSANNMTGGVSGTNSVGSAAVNAAADAAAQNGGPVKTYDGFIAVLKESFGFIETLQHDEEVFFHFSNFIDGSPTALELGNEVEYTLSKRNASNLGNCLPAENVKLLPRGTIAQPKVLEEQYSGLVVRPLRCINPDQSQYSGLVQAMCEQTGEVLSQHEFGITSLVNKRDLLQRDDAVTFRVDEAGRAAELSAVRKKKRANVNSIKGLFGFLDYEVEKDKKLFFHMSEVQGNASSLYAGDCVEFSVVTNQVSKRNGKTSACNVVKVMDSSATRPERLMLTRLKINSIDDSVPRVIVIRQPKGPDGHGFGAATRMPRMPGLMSD